MLECSVFFFFLSYFTGDNTANNDYGESITNCTTQLTCDALVSQRGLHQATCNDVGTPGLCTALCCKSMIALLIAIPQVYYRCTDSNATENSTTNTTTICVRPTCTSVRTKGSSNKVVFALCLLLSVPTPHHRYSSDVAYPMLMMAF